MTHRFQYVTALLAGAVLLALAVPAWGEDAKGVVAPSGETVGGSELPSTFGDKYTPPSGAKSGIKEGGKSAVFGKPGTPPAGKFVTPSKEGGRRADHGAEKDGHEGRHHKKFPRRRYPVIVYPLGGSYAVTTGQTEIEVEEEPGANEEAAGEEAVGEEGGIFAVTNGTEQEMTVYDNGKTVCVLAPGVICSFDVSKGTHKVSASIGDSQTRRELPRTSGGKTVVVWEALKKAD